MSAVTPLTSQPLDLGEGARWVDGRLVYVDIMSGSLYERAADPAGCAPAKPDLLMRLDVPLGAVAPVRTSPGSWVAAAGDGITP